MSGHDQTTAQAICLRLSRRTDIPADVRACLEQVAELIVCQIHHAEDVALIAGMEGRAARIRAEAREWQK